MIGTLERIQIWFLKIFDEMLDWRLSSFTLLHVDCPSIETSMHKIPA